MLSGHTPGETVSKNTLWLPDGPSEVDQMSEESLRMNLTVNWTVADNQSSAIMTHIANKIAW